MEDIRDRPALSVNGFIVLVVMIVLSLIIIGAGGENAAVGTIPFVIISILIVLSGFTIINPNEARVLTFFGRYMGTVTMNGLVWTIPVTQKQKVSLRFINFTSPKLKVNDSNGNPIEIGSVIVWRVENAAKAIFTVDAYQEFISNQSEIVIRSIAAQYPYDAEGKTSLRGSTGEITEKLVNLSLIHI